MVTSVTKSSDRNYNNKDTNSNILHIGRERVYCVLCIVVSKAKLKLIAMLSSGKWAAVLVSHNVKGEICRCGY